MPGATYCQSKGLTSDLWGLRMNSKAKQCDLMEATKEAQLQQERADPEVWNKLCGIHWGCGAGSKIRSSTEQAAQRCKTKRPQQNSCWHPSWQESDIPTIHGPLAAENEHVTVSVPSRHAWRSTSTTKRSWSLEDKMGHDECCWETRNL